MYSMNLLQAPNQHHFEVLISVDWVTCIIEQGRSQLKISGEAKVNCNDSLPRQRIYHYATGILAFP